MCAHMRRQLSPLRSDWVRHCRLSVRSAAVVVSLAVLQVGVVSAAVGSAYVERQGTKVLCAMYVHGKAVQYSAMRQQRRIGSATLRLLPLRRAWSLRHLSDAG